jgi:potassium/hydrogen antiporter
MHSALRVDTLILAGAALLAVGVVASSLAERFRAPALLVFLGLGMLIADDGLAWVRFDDPDLAQTVGVLALVIILFDGGLSLDHRAARSIVGPAAVLATVGTAVTAGLVAVVARALLHVGWNTALLLGAVIGSTDAAAVFAVVRRVPLPPRLVALLETESGLNDPMAVLLTMAVIEAWREGVTVGGVAAFGVRQLLGGTVVGIVVGALGAAAVRRLPRDGATLHPILALAVGGLAYGVAARLGASGFLAVYLCGAVVARIPSNRLRRIRSFHEALAGIAQIGLFLMLGLLVFPNQLPGVTVSSLVVTATLALVARPTAVWVSLAWFRFPARELAMLSWAGLRGAVPIVLATFPRTAGHPDGPLVFDVVFFVVLLSTAVQGLTIGRVARRLGLGAGGGPDGRVAP